MADSEFLPPLGPVETEALRRRQRSKNLAMLSALCALVVLLYAISMAKFPAL